MHADPPVTYRRRDGSTGTTRVPVADWPNPRIECREDGTVWQEITESPGWIHVGWAPRPNSRLQWFVHHVCHGLLMRYPLRDVVTWAWRRR